MKMDDKSKQGKPPFVLVKAWCDALASDDVRVDPAVKRRATEMLGNCFNSEQEIIDFLKVHQNKAGKK